MKVERKETAGGRVRDTVYRSNESRTRLFAIIVGNIAKRCPRLRASVFSRGNECRASLLTFIYNRHCSIKNNEVPREDGR